MAEVLGRDKELAAVRAFLDRADAGPGALVIEGPAGIGKSTLWLAAVAETRDRGFVVFTSRPAETERLLATVVLGDLFGNVPPEAIANLPVPRRRAFESALLRRDNAGAPVDSRALGVALVTLLPSLAGGRPVLLAIDDDQWMDAPSAMTLSFAVRRLQGERVSLLVSRRTPDVPVAALEEAFQPASVERLVVGPLSIGALHALLRERLGSVFSRPMQLRLHEVSGGNPFYALEIARAQSPDALRDSSTVIAVPASLERLVDARLGMLDEATQQALLLIAAHGRFPVDALRPMSIPPEAVDRAHRASVIEITERVARFTHPLLASAVYWGATESERRAAHRRLAAIVEDPVHRGRHLALGADGPDVDLAAQIEAAARVARDRGVSLAAAELAEHALLLTPLDDLEGRGRRAATAARAHSAAGDGRRARKIATDMVAEAPAGRARAEALTLMADTETPSAAVPLLEEALAEAAGAPELQAAIHAALADKGYFALSERDIDKHARASLRLAELIDDDGLRADALSILAVADFNAGRPRALDMAELAYRLATQLKDPEQVRKAGAAVGHLLTWIGDTDRARVWLEARLAESTDRDERARREYLWYLALVELWAGRWGVARGYADEVRAIGTEYGIESPDDFFPASLLALHEGDFAWAKSLSARVLSVGDHAVVLKTHHGLTGIYDLWTGDPEAAIVHFEGADQSADAAASYDPSMRHWRPEHVEALLQVGRIDDATTLTDEWEKAARRLNRQRVLAQATRCRGVIAAARGDIAAAVNILEEAVARHQEAGDPFGRARAELALGGNRRRAKQKRAAREALEAARTGFEALGASSWAAAARSELGRIGGRTRVAGLSPSELSVAALVAEGRTNREIASSLFLGERTVASHLTHIYAKLGIRSRTELARHFASKVQTS